MNHKGFTLIELLAVVVILIIITLIVIPHVFDIVQNMRQTSFDTNKNMMVEASKIYIANNEDEAPVSINSSIEISLLTLVSNGYINEVLDPKSHTICDYTNSSITITRIAGGGLIYSPKLICDNYTDEIVDENDIITPTFILSRTTENSGTIIADDMKSIYFDGSDDVIVLPRMIQDDFTIEYEFKSPSTGIGTGTSWFEGAGLVDAEIGSVTNDFGTSLNANGQVMAGIGNPDTTIISSTGYNNNNKHTVRFTRNGTTGEIKLYLDNILAQTGTASTASRTAPTYINIGRLQKGWNYFRGYIGNVRFWNIVTSSDMDTDLSGTENGLVGYYKFDEGTGTVLTDYSGHGNNGTIYGTPQWLSTNSGIKDISIYQGNVTTTYMNATPYLRERAEVMNYDSLAVGTYTIVVRDYGNNADVRLLQVESDEDSICFDGINDYIDIPRSITQNFTIEFQFKSSSGIGTSTSWYNGAGLVDAEVNGYTRDFGSSLNAQGRVLAGTGSDTYLATSLGNPYNNNIWHTFRFTRTTAGNLNLYIDDILKASGTGISGDLSAPANINIGRIHIGSNYFNGYIKNVRLWDVVTSSDMGAPLVGDETGLKAYYKFNEGSGTTLTDYSNNTNNGTIYGTPTWH